MKICIGILSWNSLNDIRRLLNSLFKEINHNLNYDIIVVDNGSTDGTIDYLESLKINVIKLYKNYGIGIAKNLFISHAKNIGSKYLLMFDSDVEIIPDSFDIMINWMENNQSVACLGQHIDYYYNENKTIDNITPISNNLDIELNVKSGCGATRAWTHYAIYRTSVFNEVRFDTEGAFGMAGYGFDDDDLGMQIATKGHDIACFRNVYVYHNINSSVDKLRNEMCGLNMHERERLFKKKWQGAI